MFCPLFSYRNTVPLFMYVNLPSYTSRTCFGAVQVGPHVIPDTHPDNVQGISFRPVKVTHTTLVVDYGKMVAKRGDASLASPLPTFRGEELGVETMSVGLFFVV